MAGLKSDLRGTVSFFASTKWKVSGFSAEFHNFFVASACFAFCWARDIF